MMSRSTIKAMDAEEDAGFWDARLRAPDSSATDRAAHEDWKNTDPANKQAFDRLQTVIDELPAIANVAEIQSMRAAALLRTHAQPPIQSTRKHWIPLGGAVAASLAILVTATIFLGRPTLNLNTPELSADLPTPTFVTRVGQRADVLLTDGSAATLNTNSKIDVRYNKDERAIHLFKGEAHFDVAHNTDYPFVVYAGNYRVIAVGTAFDVKTVGDKVEVTVTEGKVAIKRYDSNNLVNNLEQNQTGLMLVAGQQFSGRPTGLAIRQKADLAKAASWRKGQAVFDDMPLALAAQEMNRYSNVKLTVADPGLANTRINGLFITGRQDSFVEALEAYLGIKSKRISETEILLEPATQ